MRDVVIAGAVRTPIGTMMGGLSDVSAVELGTAVIRESIHRAKVNAASIEEVWMGNVLQAGLGQGPARQAALRA